MNNFDTALILYLLNGTLSNSGQEEPVSPDEVNLLATVLPLQISVRQDTTDVSREFPKCSHNCILDALVS